MREDTITALPDPNGFSADPLTDLIRSGARQLIEQALEAELGALLAQFSNETTPEGHARIVRHGHLPEREVMTGVGPDLAVGDGGLGFWAALREVFGATCEQRCWFHKTGNVLNTMPKSVQAKAKGHLNDIWQAETKGEAGAAFDFFVETYGVKYEKAVAKLVKDRKVLLAFYDFLAEHWKHNPELDQLSGRFAVNRGQLGMLLYRTVKDYGLLCARCRDAAQDGRGFMLALGDEQVIAFLNLIGDGQRAAIDARLQATFNELIT